MKTIAMTIAGLALLPLLSAGAMAQMAPTYQVMPAPNKPFPIFQQDDYNCRQWANSQVAGAQQQANSQVAGGLIGGAVLGAGVGALIGGGRGAAIGAGTGAVVGTTAGAQASAQTQAAAQQQYDIAYGQCMYSRGNQVPGYFQPAPASAAPPPPPPPPGNYPPPPPPGYPPPPPPPGYH